MKNLSQSISVMLDTARTLEDRWVSLLGAIAVTTSLVVLTAWFVHRVDLIQISPSFPPMQRNTAAGIFLCGLALLLATSSTRWRKVGQFCGFLAGLLGLLTLLEYGLRLDFGIDQVLGPAFAMAKSPSPGRMAPLSCICFMLAGTALLTAFSARTLRWKAFLVALTSSLIIAISLASLFGYLVGTVAGTGWTQVTWIAIPTAVCFLLLGAALIRWVTRLGNSSRSVSAEDVSVPSWVPLCTCIGAGTVLFSLMQGALSGYSAQSGALRILGFFGAVLLTLFFIVIVPMKPKHKIAISLGMALTVLVFTAVFSYQTLLQDRDSQSWVVHTHVVLIATNAVFADIARSDASYRGYMWRGLPEDLEAWDRGVNKAGRDLAELRLLTADNLWQQEAVGRVEASLAKAIAEIRSRIRVQQQQGNRAGLEQFRRGRGWQTLVPVDSLLGEMQEEERRLMHLRTETAERNFNHTKLVVILGNGLAMLFLSIAGMMAFYEARERKRARDEVTRLNAEVKEQAKKLELILGSIGDGVIALDANGGVPFMNASARRILGLDNGPAEAQLEEVDAYWPEPTTLLAKEQWPILRALRGEATDAERMLVRHRHSGWETWVSVTARPVQAHGAIWGAVAIFQDVSASRRYQAELTAHLGALEKSNRDLLAKTEEINAFYHMVSHELKTPLTSTREFIALVLENVAGETNSIQREYLDLAKEGCEQIAHCINDLLDATKAETNKMDVQVRPVDLKHLVEQCMASMRLSIQAKNIDFQLLPQKEEPPTVMADGRRLTQVLLNLFSNARKFTPSGGAIEVEIRQPQEDPSWVLVSVKNNGRAIAPESMDRIFDRLFQEKKSDFSTADGLGLGLFVSREIVHAHGGRIWAESPNGKGAVFTFSLKRAGRGGSGEDMVGDVEIQSATLVKN